MLYNKACKKEGQNAKAYQNTTFYTLYHLSRNVATKLFRRGYKRLPHLQAFCLPDLPLYGHGLGPSKVFASFKCGCTYNTLGASIDKDHKHCHDYGEGEDTCRSYGAHERLEIAPQI